MYNPVRDAVEFFEESQDLFNADISEANLKSRVITPMLEKLGFNPSLISYELNKKKQIPDFCIFQSVKDCQAAESRRFGKPAICIGEIKRPSVDIDNRSPRNSPERQLERYLQTHNQASENTIGVLTNGRKWKVYKLQDNRINLLASAKSENLTRRSRLEAEKLFQLISEASETTPSSKNDVVRNLLQTLANPGSSPEEIAKIVLHGKQKSLDVLGIPENSYARQAYYSDWTSKSAHLFTGQQSQSEENSLFPEELHFGLVELDTDLENIRKDDILNARKGFEEISGKAPLLILVTMKGDPTTARVSLSHNGIHSMTAEFRVPNAESTPRITLGNILEETKREVFDPEKTLEHLSLKPLQQRFYAEIQKWITHSPGWKEEPGTRNLEDSKRTRTAILLNLLRVMFCFILKQKKMIPEEIFDPAEFPNVTDYHKEILAVFFHDVLNKPDNERDLKGLDSTTRKLAKLTGFLNGSIFAQQDSDKDLEIPAEFYRNSDLQNPGLYDILERYNWTADEHSHSETDQSMDPDLLGNILERFISMLDNPDEETRERQPDGTYYTPKDVVREMCIRALSSYAKSFALRYPNLDILMIQKIFRENLVPLDYIPPCRKTLQKFRDQLSRETIADLALGSAIFPVEMTKVLKQAYIRIDRILGIKSPDPEQILNSIVENQIYGCDVQPLAVIISRLRIFLMLLAERKSETNDKPLPNLEARIICAQTLKTSPTIPGNSLDSKAYEDITQKLESIFLEWYQTHDEDRKSELRNRERALKSQLKGKINPDGHVLILDPNPHPCDSDLRDVWPQIFSNEDPGFGIAIGNPPYANTISAFTSNEKKAFSNMGFEDTNRLEHLFTRLTLSLTRKNGIICQIVPSAVSIREDFQKTRKLFQNSCRQITLSHFDNRPSGLFPKTPFLKQAKENRTRPLVMTASKGKGNVEILTSVFQKWHKKDRTNCIQKQPRCSIPKELLNICPLENQWPRISSNRIAKLLSIARQNGIPLSNFCKKTAPQESDSVLEYPKTAYLYLSILPAGSIQKSNSTRGQRLVFSDPETAKISFLALNTVISYTWWLAWDDSFHVKQKPIESFPIPEKWLNDPSTRQKILQHAKDLENLIPHVIKTISVQGGKSQTLNFLENERSKRIIDLASMFYIEAVGIQKRNRQPLIAEMKNLQTNDNWNA